MTLNVKALKAVDIQQAHDVICAHLTATPNDMGAGQNADEAAVSLMETVLKAANYQLASNTLALTRSGRAALTRGKRKEAVFDGLSDDGKALVVLALGGQTPSNIQPYKPTPSVQAQSDFQDTDMPAATDTDYGPINSILQIMTNETLHFGTVLKIRDTLREEVARVKVRADAAPTGEPYVAPEVSGLANMPKNHSMLPAINAMIAGVLPDEKWENIIDEIEASEQSLKTFEVADATRRQAAAPKTPAATPVAAAPQAVAPAMAITDTSSVLEQTLKITQKSGYSIFNTAYGASQKVLDFNVPVMSFDAPHPDVPEIDPTFKFYVPVLAEALHSVSANEILWLYGDSGCGKSEMWKQLAAHLGMPYTRLNMDGQLTRGDIIGVNRMVPNADRQMEMRFIDGILPRAMARPGLLLIDELDLGDPETMAVLQPVLEGEPLRILEDHGRIVRPHPEFRIAVTGNTTGLGSDTNAYLNVFQQSAATRDRISAFVQMPYMTPSIEEAVLKERMPGIDVDFVSKLIKLANKVREGYAQGEINQLFSTRATQAAARRYMRFEKLYPTPEIAARAILETVILNRMDEASRNTVNGLIDNIF